MKLEEIYEELIKQVNLKTISTVDIVTELQKLYTSVTDLSKELNKCKDDKVVLIEKNLKLTNEIIPTLEYKNLYANFKTEKLAYSEEKFKFSIEKEYIMRENERLNEILMALLASKSVNYSDSNYGSNGSNSSMNYNENPVKPSLKNLSNRNTK